MPNPTITNLPSVTIGFVPRERFSLAAEALQRIFDSTQVPFNLIVVNCNIPVRYWQAIETVIAEKKNVRVIYTDDYLLANQAKNRVAQAASDPFICFLENDVLVTQGWLSRLLIACQDHPADVAVPLIFEGPLGAKKIHWDDRRQAQLRDIETDEGLKREIIPLEAGNRKEKDYHRHTIESLEEHCLLFRADVLNSFSFDEALTLDVLDIGLGLQAAQATVVFEPSAVVNFVPPYPPEADELDYYLMRWDIERAHQSRDRIYKKWNLIRRAGSIVDFVIERNRIGQLYSIREKIETLVPHGASFILVDEDLLNGNPAFQGLNTLPLTEHNGEYWGMPADDEAAISEVNRLQQQGARALVFIWHTFWWLKHYEAFHDYLRQHFTCSVSNDQLIVFELPS